MLEDLGLSNLDELVDQIVPKSILIDKEALKGIPQGCDEKKALSELRVIQIKILLVIEVNVDIMKLLSSSYSEKRI